MQTLAIDPAVPFLIPNEPVHVLLVGCGGTGSHIAQALARLAYHVRARGDLPPLTITLMDGDLVEPKNVGRQLFSLADVGHNKAEALAARLNAVFGLAITAIPQMLGTIPTPVTSGYGVLVGAVDTPAGRRELRRALDQYHAHWRLWLDAGNERDDGQVVVGGAIHPQQLHTAFAVPGVCGALPAPHLVYPDMLSDDDRPVVALACAEAMLADAQSLMVNQAMAAIVAQYLYQIVIARRLTTFVTTIDLASLSMRSQPTTAAAVAAATKIRLTDLCRSTATKRPKKGRRAA